MPIHESSMFAAVSTMPLRTTDGSVSPTGPLTSKRPTSSTTVAAIAVGVGGVGVSTRTLVAASSPAARSTGATLMPVPPTSTPTSWLSDIDLRAASWRR